MIDAKSIADEVVAESDRIEANFTDACNKFEALQIKGNDLKIILQGLIELRYDLSRKLKDAISEIRGLNKKLLKMMLKENKKAIRIMADLIKLLDESMKEVYGHDNTERDNTAQGSIYIDNA